MMIYDLYIFMNGYIECDNHPNSSPQYTAAELIHNRSRSISLTFKANGECSTNAHTIHKVKFKHFNNIQKYLPTKILGLRIY